MKHLCMLPVVIAGVLVLGSCSELKKDLPPPVDGSTAIHEPGWNDPTSSAFHGVVLKEDDYMTDECIRCHARDGNGGVSGVSCFGCHTSYPHKPGWVDTTSSDFHGKFLRLGMGTLDECAKCHGTDFAGGTSGVSCYSCHASYPHKEGWLSPTSPNYHGVYLKSRDWNTAECQSCHGADYAGGTSGIACYSCHPSFPHTVFASFGGHPPYLYSKGYPLSQCKECHGSSYTGGAVTNVSCEQSGCHVDANSAPKSPESCSTCHGNFRATAADTLSPAPPKGVLGDSLTSSLAVGAHGRHLLSGTLGKTVRCQECHSVPANTFGAGHLDTPLPADVAFHDTLARLATADGTFQPDPSYNHATGLCSNTYCHGNWVLRKAGSSFGFVFTDTVMTGANYQPRWNNGAGDASCGTCHGLPPTGHSAATLSACANCHGDVVNSSGNIIDKTKHINGKVNAFNAERPMGNPTGAPGAARVGPATGGALRPSPGPGGSSRR